MANGECARLLGLLWREAAGVPAASRSNAAGAAPGAKLGKLTRLAPVLQVVRARYAERLTLPELAGVVNLHPAYFSGLFKDVTGLPPLRYLARYRLDRARELLLTTGLPVGEIAAVTGFRDVFHLSHVFRQAEGVSPSAFRKAETATKLP
jgi:AraC-like DNA-binding protein